MKKTLLGLSALAVMAVAVAFSRPEAGPPALAIKSEKRNPWTNLSLNNAPENFQFAIVSDRSGGHRAQVFEQAVARLNLLQPEFVMSVGDLIEGGKKSHEKYEAEWKEFDGYVKRLQMPFFYAPGNHDANTPMGDKVWRERLGRRWYHFVYRDVLFLCLNSEDPEGSGAPSLGKAQQDYALATLAANKGVRWTFVFIHRPIWASRDQTKRGWKGVEKALAGRSYTVFCGHIHRFRKFVRQGMDYYQLATTGGVSKMRGVGRGEFDQVAWVTMKKTGPVIAHVVLDHVLPDNLATPPATEKGVSRKGRLKTVPVKGIVHRAGSPLAGALVTFRRKDGKATGDGVTAGDGSFVPSTYAADDGLPVGTYNVAVTLRRPLYLPDRSPGPNLLPAKYASALKSGLTVEVKEGGSDLRIDLE